MEARATEITTGKVRLSFVHVWEPKANKSGKLKYSLMMLIPKSDKATLKRIKEAIEAVKADPKSLKKWGGKVPAGLKLTLHDGDDEDTENFEKYPEVHGHYYINCSTDRKPKLLSSRRGPDGKFEEITDPFEIYSGCYARVHVNFFAYEADGSKGITCGLNNVLKVADGESLGGSAGNAQDAFDDDFKYEDEEEESIF